MRKLVVAILYVFLILLAACRDRLLDVDISGIEVDMKVSRFEKDIFAIDPAKTGEAIPSLQNKYPVFFSLFNMQIMRLGDVNDPMYPLSLKRFITDPGIRDLYKECLKQYPDISDLKEQLEEAFRHYLYYFPEKAVPEVVTFISAFNYAVIRTDSLLGIGLDRYFGKDYEYYPSLGYPQYVINRMRKEYIVVDCMKGWAQIEFGADSVKTDFLGDAVYNGKVLYFLDAVLPDTHDSLKIGYTAKQLDWCRENEAHIWSNFIDKELLFSNDRMKYMKFINDGPTTNGLPSESPAMIGVWTGWQVVKAYMKNNPGVTLKELMRNNDAREILSKSKYKPKK